MGLLSIHTENIQLNRVDTSATTPSMNESCSVQDLLKEYHDVFDGELGCLPGVEHLEVNTSIQPVKMPLRKVPLAVQERLEEEISRLEAMGVIEKISQPTDWVSGMVVAEKRNGKLRLCIDPKPLNKALCRSSYPMPTDGGYSLPPQSRQSFHSL